MSGHASCALAVASGPHLSIILIMTLARNEAATISGSSLSWPASFSSMIRNASSSADLYAAEVDAAVSLSRLGSCCSSSIAGRFWPFGRKGGFWIGLRVQSGADASRSFSRHLPRGLAPALGRSVPAWRRLMPTEPFGFTLLAVACVWPTPRRLNHDHISNEIDRGREKDADRRPCARVASAKEVEPTGKERHRQAYPRPPDHARQACVRFAGGSEALQSCQRRGFCRSNFNRHSPWYGRMAPSTVIPRNGSTLEQSGSHQQIRAALPTVDCGRSPQRDARNGQ